MDTKPQGSRDDGPPPHRIGVDVIDDKPHRHHMLPVWFFIGVVLTIYGVMILAQGIYELSHPVGTVLENLHAAVWWGALMILVGVVFVQKNRRPL
jgi:hypothetical protein